MTPDGEAIAAVAPRRRDGAESATAALAFAFVATVVFTGPLRHTADATAVALLFVLLVGGYLALSVGAVARALRDAARPGPLRALAVPAVLWAGVVLYSADAGLPVAPRALAFAVYLAAPAVPLLLGGPTPPGRAPARELSVILLLWLPIELRLLPTVPIPATGGHDVSRFVGLVEGLYLFLVVRPLPDVGYTLLLRRRDVGVAAAVFLVYALVALPIGFGTGFLRWHPHAMAGGAVTRPLLIYFATGIPEEFLFRGLLQNLLARWWGPGRALPVASVVFGLAHLPDPRYVLLAAIAGLAYGWVYQRTARITASAVTHALVDATWVTLLR